MMILFSRTRAMTAAVVVLTLAAAGVVTAPSASATTYPYQLDSNQLHVGFAADGSIQSLKINNDLYDTQYVMNPDVAPDQGNEPNAKYRQWLGNALFSYATGTGAITKSGVGSTPWKTAWTTESGDGRTVSSTPTSVTVTYKNSANSEGVSGFTFTENYTLDTDGSLIWKQTVTNTSGKQLVIGDWGIPLPDNELWFQGDEIYETRVIAHSFVGGDSSYVSWQRPSGQGPSILLSSDTGTGSGFEYQDRWRTAEVGSTPWADQGSNAKALNVYYRHSMAIQKTNRGYLSSTALTLADQASKTYTYRIAKVDSDQGRHDALFNQGLLDTEIQPSAVVPYDEKAEVALRVKGSITSVTAKNLNDSKSASPTNPTVAYSRTNGDYRIYSLAFDRSQLGQNRITVAYTDSGGRSRSTQLQYYVTDNPGSALSAHADFMVKNQQWTTADGISADDIRNGTYDDWLMNAADGSVPSGTTSPQGRRNSYAGYWGLGDDWGLTHGEFLAEKNAIVPVKTQVQSLDLYTEKALWEHLMGNAPNETNPYYLIHDFWEQGKPGAQNDTPTYRGYAYPHVYNTFFSMYKIAKQYPSLIQYSHPATWYLNVAYNIFKALYEGPVAYNWNTGLMGEQSTPDIIAALRSEGMLAQADDITSKMSTKYSNFSSSKYPYGSEYSFDNTGEESVYMLARSNVNNDTTNALRVMRDIVQKTRATRGQMPVWYWYGDPTTVCGENWWQFQYSAALAGYAMDDYINHTSALETGADAVSSTDRAVLERLNYAGKLANIANINSGQISSAPANIGASAWTYQSEKGNLGTSGVGGGDNVQLLNGWRGMTGESDLGLWGVLQTLSTDVVTDDPVFGTVAYGGTVSSDQYSYTVTPNDGLSRKLNLVTQQLSVDLNSDRYDLAIVGKNNGDVRLNMRNLNGGVTHPGSLTVSGLAQGSYAVIVNGVQQGTVNNYTPSSMAGKLARPVTVDFTAPSADQYVVHLVTVPAPANQAPAVNAGPDQSGVVDGADTITLRGTASDDGLGNPNGTLSTAWSVVSAPSGRSATITTPSALSTTVTTTGPGTYTFRLSGTDGSLSSTDDVSVTVTSPRPLPANWVNYTFDSASGSAVPDTSGNGNGLTMQGNASVGTDGSASVLKLDGSGGTDGQLPSGILVGATALTITARVKLSSVSTWSRLFDFGSGTSKGMFLTPSYGDGHVGFSIFTSKDVSSQIFTSYSIQPGSWTTIKLTLAPNSSGGTYTGTIYADGVQIGQNGSMTVTPAQLGRTTDNYLGKSAFGDPFLNAEYDSFQIQGVVQ